MRLLVLFAALILPSGLMAEDKKDEKKVKDEEAILGTWKLKKSQAPPGSPCHELPKEYADQVRLEFEKGKATLYAPDDIPRPGSWAIDPTAKVKTIDLTAAGEKFLGVYELEGDTLRLCFHVTHDDEKLRPTVLKEGKKLTLLTFQRPMDEKKDK